MSNANTLIYMGKLRDGMKVRRAVLYTNTAVAPLLQCCPTESRREQAFSSHRHRLSAV